MAVMLSYQNVLIIIIILRKDCGLVSVGVNTLSEDQSAKINTLEIDIPFITAAVEAAHNFIH